MTSPAAALYLAWRNADTDMAAGCCVDGDVELLDRCEWLDTPSGPHATAAHFGPYSTLHQTHAAIQKWCKAANRSITGPCWKSYPVSRSSEPKSAKWQTEVYYTVQVL